MLQTCDMPNLVAYLNRRWARASEVHGSAPGPVACSDRGPNLIHSVMALVRRARYYTRGLVHVPHSPPTTYPRNYVPTQHLFASTSFPPSSSSSHHHHHLFFLHFRVCYRFCNLHTSSRRLNAYDKAPIDDFWCNHILACVIEGLQQNQLGSNNPILVNYIHSSTLNSRNSTS